MAYYISSGQSGNGIILYENWMDIYSGGVANSTTINKWGYMFISGGTANNTTVNSGGGMSISSGGVANSTTVNHAYGSMYIYSGGVANSTTVNNYGYMYILSGGVANSTTVKDSYMFISSGGVANSTTVNYGGGMYISSGGTASIVWNPWQGTIHSSAGAVVTYLERNNNIYYGGVYSGLVSKWDNISDFEITFDNSMLIYSGGTANSTTVNDGGRMYISSGGTANRTTVDSGGRMYISSGGTATNITAFDNAWLGIIVASNTYIQGTYNSSAFEMKNAYISGYTINKGRMVIASDGQADNTTVNIDCYMDISSGGVANNTTVNCSGSMYIYSGGVANETTISEYCATMYIFSGGVANSTTVKNYGDMYIRSGGVANSTTVNSGGWMQISSGGVANSTTVSDIYAEMYIYSGGKHTGSLQMANGATVSAYQGSIVDFTVADRTASDGYLINNLSLINGSPTYTITVSAEQSDGTYKLAQGAGSFTGSITIGDGTTSYGSITVNGEDFIYNDATYSLDQVNGNLTLTISKFDIVPPAAPTYTVSNTALTNQNVTVSAVFSNDSVVKQYSLNGKDWQTYTAGIVFTENGTVSFRSQDAAGNFSEVVSYQVSNIDKVAPTLDITADKTAPTNQNVVLTATVSDGTVEYYDGKNWVAGSTLTVSENGIYKFRVTDRAGNVTEKSVFVDNINKTEPDVPDKPDVPDVPEISDYIFIKDNYSAKINGKKQNGVSLSFGWNAFDKIPEGFDFTDKTVIIVNSKSVFAAEIDIDGLNTLYGNVMIPTEKTGSYKLTLASKNQVDFIYADNSHMNFELFATVNVKDGASVGTVSGGKLTVSETEKSSVKKDVVTENYSYSKTVAASGKVNISNASAANISGYATVILDNGTAETLSNADTKISYQRKYVDGIADTITETETYSVKGTATLKNGSKVDNISGFKTVKLTDSFAANIELGDSYTEKFTLKKGVENTVVKETFTGTVTLENSKIGSVCGMNKVTASKGFNFIESYEGSDGNDTLTINKNAVLSLGSIDFKDGAKDKLVNNGTLILTAEINRGYISGKGEIAACDEVLQSMKYTYGILNLGATADGFRTTKYELADSSAKKAVKWDLKADHQGWLSGDSDCIDTVDFVKFKTGKESSILEISGFSGSDTISLVDKKGNVAELTFSDGVFTAELAAKTDYTLQLGISKGDDSMSYSLAIM